MMSRRAKNGEAVAIWKADESHRARNKKTNKTNKQVACNPSQHAASGAGHFNKRGPGQSDGGLRIGLAVAGEA
eukprot:123606-Chlamydomonas_euryale.AAC.1